MSTESGAQQAWKDLFNPFDTELVAAPYSHYDRLRREEPIHWSPPLQAWVLTRMEDVRAVLNDETFTALETSTLLADLARRAGRDYDPLIRVLDATLFFKDGPRHRNDRRTISKILNRTTLTALKPVIEDIATALASELLNLADYDAIQRFADPLPQYVMAHILGIPVSDIAVLSGLLADLTRIFDVVSLDAYDSINDKIGDALQLLKDRIAFAAAGSVDTGLSIFYAGASGSPAERLADAAATALFTYRVGSETTTGLIGVLIHTLINRPALYSEARENPLLVPSIVSEVLRLESNVQRSVRIGRESRSIGGKTIKAGERLMLLLGAANRDPAAFDKPNSLDVTRSASSDVAFGGGHHFCLGASLARLEGCVALDQFLRMPKVEQAGEEKWYLGRAIRRLTQLPVRASTFSQSDSDG